MSQTVEFGNSDFLRAPRETLDTNPLNVVFMRHVASEALRSVTGDVRQALRRRWVDEEGILSPKEADLCTSRGMVLPLPYFRVAGRLSPENWFIPRDFLQEVVRGANRGEPQEIYSGVFGIFHGGYWTMIEEALVVAGGNRFLYGDDKGRRNVWVLVEGDDYVRDFKSAEPIFSMNTRMGWFRYWPELKVTYWRSTRVPGTGSWESALIALQDRIEFGNHQLVHFLLANPETSNSETDRQVLWMRAEQITKAGFGIDFVPFVVDDVSTTMLTQRFGLVPFDRKLEAEWEKYGM